VSRIDSLDGWLMMRNRLLQHHVLSDDLIEILAKLNTKLEEIQCSEYAVDLDYLIFLLHESPIENQEIERPNKKRKAEEALSEAPPHKKSNGNIRFFGQAPGEPYGDEPISESSLTL